MGWPSFAPRRTTCRTRWRCSRRHFSYPRRCARRPPTTNASSTCATIPNSRNSSILRGLAMSKESTEAKHARVKKIIATLKRTHPDAKLALDFSNPLELLIALILAAQARDDLVNEVTAELFKKHR